MVAQTCVKDGVGGSARLGYRCLTECAPAYFPNAVPQIAVLCGSLRLQAQRVPQLVTLMASRILLRLAIYLMVHLSPRLNSALQQVAALLLAEAVLDDG